MDMSDLDSGEVEELYNSEGSMPDSFDSYMAWAKMFNTATGIGERNSLRTQEYVDRFGVVEEELDELSEVIDLMMTRAYYDSGFNSTKAEELESEAVEELADLIVTCFSMAEALDIDIERAYKKKMKYNMTKTGDNVEDGKVVDDSNIEKPDFGGLVSEPDISWSTERE